MQAIKWDHPGLIVLVGRLDVTERLWLSISYLINGYNYNLYLEKTTCTTRTVIHSQVKKVRLKVGSLWLCITGMVTWISLWLTTTNAPGTPWMRPHPISCTVRKLIWTCKVAKWSYYTRLYQRLRVFDSEMATSRFAIHLGGERIAITEKQNTDITQVHDYYITTTQR